MKKKRKGFTLIELLAVIVILGLLMAIAIPSITKYITQSRKKTITSTIGNYVGALVNDVNDLTYTFTETNTVYAVPIECIALERGGTNPFGEWHQANDAYWAYVLVQYNDETSSYTYGYTFKDSAGYGLYPTSQAKINESGKQIQTGLNLKKPESGSVTNITSIDNWNGFQVKSDTDLVVLKAGKEGEVGDGKETCTLQQKGKNYDQIKNDNDQNTINTSTLVNLIVEQNPLITTTPTLTTSSNNTSDASGLYKSTATNNSKETYYFRGNVTNNNAKFAGLDWKIIRINEDGTVRLILNDFIDNEYYNFNTDSTNYRNMYYSNSDTIKPLIDSWYQKNIIDNGYDSYVASGMFCEQAKVKILDKFTAGAATMKLYTDYTPNFKCTADGNGKGLVKNEDGTLAKVGLITYDEVIHAGGYYGKGNSDYYLYNDQSIWTMSPAGFGTTAFEWNIFALGNVERPSVSTTSVLRPVINLSTGVLATGTGTSTDPYVVQTK